MQDFKNLTAWQAARRLTKSVYQLSADFPRSEEFGGRRGDREFRRFLDVAMGSACELESELIVSFDLAFIAESVQEQALSALIEINRMLSGLIGRLRQQLKAES